MHASQCKTAFSQSPLVVVTQRPFPNKVFGSQVSLKKSRYSRIAPIVASNPGLFSMNKAAETLMFGLARPSMFDFLILRLMTCTVASAALDEEIERKTPLLGLSLSTT